MTNHTNGYAEQSHKFLNQAFVELSQDDLRQASEKGWGAASQIIKAYADQRGFDHYSHQLLWNVLTRLIAETDDSSYRTLFNDAGGLHTNFYEGQFTTREVRESLESVAQFIDRVEALINSS